MYDYQARECVVRPKTYFKITVALAEGTFTNYLFQYSTLKS